MMTNEIRPKRVIIYVRLSDEDRYKRNKSDDSESIVNQKSMLLKYALEKGWEVVAIYSDDDYSGADNTRPGFNKMIESCKNGETDIVLCKTQSRFSRDMEIIEKYIHNKFVEWNVRFVSIVDNADTDVVGNKKARQINGLINEWYLEDLSDNIRSSLQNRRKDGLFLGSFAPYGYKKDPNNKNKLLIDPVAAQIVREIFDMYKSGMGYLKIVKNLNDRKIPTPSVYKRENGSKYVSRNKDYEYKYKWNQDTISKILRNEVYIGNLVQGKKTYVSYKNHKQIIKPKEEWVRVCDTHEAIIDKETWNYVESRIKRKQKSTVLTGEVYMFSKKVYCKECGKIFIRNIYKTKDGKTAYLKCREARNHSCNNISSIRCDVLEKIVLDEINKKIDKYYSLNELEQLMKQVDTENKNNKINTYKLEQKELENKINKKENHCKILYEDRLEGNISNDEYVMLKDKFNIELNGYYDRLEVINEELSKIEKNNKLEYSHILKKYKHINKLNVTIIDEFIDKITIGLLDIESKNRTIEIDFNF